ncbi:PaaI family thioesterase [Virgibacillus alimentarius]|uniref:Acyl-CoA thioesterase n=1 Tax=Virgibacillus alimentarius TaxID=698769 RepID=A0ABS4SAG0_9BACI|nr:MULTISPECIES: PaaI family thioesterase [Virgibacillus]MBP2258483.1 acyl-CoA thioesterase [Virgibacillus alimentarius]HLR65561.1 PaaI family thioesterase [Virgibacillus sp.]
METKTNDKQMIDFFTSDPFANHLNIMLEHCEAGYAKVKMPITKDLLNFNGAANGGAIFSLADYAFAVASNSHGRTAVGLNVNMSYLAPGKKGEEIICIAKETKLTPKIATYEMKVYNASDDLIATMEGMVYRKKENFMEK